MNRKKLEKIDLWLGSIILVFMVIVVAVQVISRAMGSPLAWSEEIARWAMIWITFAGASYSFRNGGLISVDYFIRKSFKAPAQKVINLIDSGLLALFFIYLGYSTTKYMALVIRKEQVYQITRVPKAIIISALLIGSILCVAFAVSQIIQIMHRGEETK